MKSPNKQKTEAIKEFKSSIKSYKNMKILVKLTATEVALLRLVEKLAILEE